MSYLTPVSFLYIPFWLYSNRVLYGRFNDLLNFTFHSGYILIKRNYWRYQGSYRLYIPFWLYSNYVSCRLYRSFELLYIPFWLYSNKTDSIRRFKTSDLYIPFWLYSNRSESSIKNRLIKTLHSILVIF